MNAQRFGKALFLGVSVKGFLEEISSWISRVSKDHPHQCEWASPTHSGPSWDKKAKEGQILSFSSWAGTSIFSCPWKSELLVYSGLRMTGLTPCPPHLQFPGVWLQTGSYAASFPGSHAFGQRLNYTISFLGYPACEREVLHPLSLHNCVSQFLCYISYIYLSVHVCINILFVLFLWENSD